MEWTGLCLPKIREEAGLTEGRVRNSRVPGLWVGVLGELSPGSKVLILMPPLGWLPVQSRSSCLWPCPRPQSLSVPLADPKLAPSKRAQVEGREVEATAPHSCPPKEPSGLDGGHRALGQLPFHRPGPSASLSAPRLQLVQLSSSLRFPPVSTTWSSGRAAPFSSVIFLFK